jgi:hypothetical protein
MELEAEPKTLVSGSLCEEKTINPRDGHYLPSASLLSWPLEKQRNLVPDLNVICMVRWRHKCRIPSLTLGHQ